MTLKMNDDELVHDMYSRLNLIINELNSIGLTKLGDADIVRNLLPQKKFVLSNLAYVALLLSIASELRSFVCFASLVV